MSEAVVDKDALFRSSPKAIAHNSKKVSPKAKANSKSMAAKASAMSPLSPPAQSTECQPEEESATSLLETSTSANGAAGVATEGAGPTAQEKQPVFTWSPAW